MAKSVASKKKLLRQGCKWRILYCSTKNYKTYLRSVYKILLTVCGFHEAKCYDHKGNEIPRITVKFGWSDSGSYEFSIYDPTETEGQ